MHCPYELFVFIIDYLKDRQCYIELNAAKSMIFDVEKGVPQGSCLGPILFLLFHCEMPQRIPSATYSQLFTDDLALIIHASPWWSRSEFASRLQQLAQTALNQTHAYAIEWKQPMNFSKTEWQWTHLRVSLPVLSLSIGPHSIQRTSLFKYLGFYVDERLSFNQHCTVMLRKVHMNSTILKYVARSQRSSTLARNLLCQAFILPMIYAVWPMLSTGSIAKIEAKNRQLSRLTHNWMDATNDEVQYMTNYRSAESKAQRFLRRFIDKAVNITPELFEDYLLCKAMPLYLRLHFEEATLISALPRGRLNRYIVQWLKPSPNVHRYCYLDRLSILLTKNP